MRTSLAPLFLWGELFLLLLVRGEGKYEGAGAPHCAPGRYTYSAVVYLSRFPYAMHTSVDVTGIEPATACLQSPGLSTFDHTLRFFSGWGIIDPGMGGRTPCCWLGTSGSRGARPEPSFVSVITSLPRKQPTLLGSTCVATDTVRTSYLSSALVHFALLGGGVASLNGFSCAAIRSCGPVGEKAHEVFTSFPPHLEAKRSGNYFK